MKSGNFTTMKQKDNTPTTESVKIETGVLYLVRQAKLYTGVPITSFITRAIIREYNRLPKSIKDKISAES